MKFEANLKAFFADLATIVPEFEAELEKRMVPVATFAHRSLMNKTSVHTGKTIRNWIASTGSPYAGVFDAIGTGPTGKTNHQPLGTENRRAANEVAAASSLANIILTGKPYKSIYVSNNSEAVYLMELGLAPLPSKDLKPRTWGMAELTYSEVVSKLSLGSL